MKKTLFFGPISLIVVVTAILLFAGSAVYGQSPMSTPSSANPAYTFPDAKTRVDRYVRGMFGPVALVETVARAGFSTWRNSPEEWGTKWSGFGKRLGSGLARNVIKGTVTYALEESFKLDSHFYKSPKRDVGSKLKNALLSTVTARRPNGKRVFGFPKIVGTYSTAVIASEWWYPHRFGWKDGLRSGTISLGIGAAFNVARELFRK